MNKIPVVATVVATYRFAFEKYFRLLGVMWVPTALYLAAMMWQLRPFFDQVQRMSHQTKDISAVFATLGHIFLFEFMSIILLVVIAVGVTKVALGHKVKWPFFYLGFGADFWRLFGGGILLFLIFVTAFVALSIITGIVAASVAPHGDPEATKAFMHNFSFVLVIAIYAIMGLIWIKLAFLLPPIVICEKRIGLGRNWTLTRSNFWRIVGAIILVLIPMLLLGLLQFASMDLFSGHGMNPFADWSTPAKRMDWSVRVMDIYKTYWYIYGPVWFLIYPITYGPLLAVSTFSYRALVREESSATTPMTDTQA